jgi:hypothetical protein
LRPSIRICDKGCLLETLLQEYSSDKGSPMIKQTEIMKNLKEEMGEWGIQYDEKLKALKLQAVEAEIECLLLSYIQKAVREEIKINGQWTIRVKPKHSIAIGNYGDFCDQVSDVYQIEYSDCFEQTHGGFELYFFVRSELENLFQQHGHQTQITVDLDLPSDHEQEVTLKKESIQ